MKDKTLVSNTFGVGINKLLCLQAFRKSSILIKLQLYSSMLPLLLLDLGCRLLSFFTVRCNLRRIFNERVRANLFKMS